MFLFLTSKYLAPFFSVSIVDFEQVTVSWNNHVSTLQKYPDVNWSLNISPTVVSHDINNYIQLNPPVKKFI